MARSIKKSLISVVPQSLGLMALSLSLPVWASKPSPTPPSIATILSQANTEKKEIRAGQTLSTLLHGVGLKGPEIQKVVTKNIFPKHFRLRSGADYLIFKDPRVKGIKFVDEYTPTSYTFWCDEQKTCRAQTIEETFIIKRETIEGQVYGSLIESIRKKTDSELLAYRFLDAYSLEYNPSRALKRGARYSLTYERLYLGNTFIRLGEVLNTSLEIKGKVVDRDFLRFNDGGVFVPVGKRVHDRPLYAPVSYIRISSPFNRRRIHPITRRRQPHLGIDFELPPMAPIFAAANGKVIKSGRTRAGGFFIRIKHDNGFQTTYNHLHHLDSRIKTGMNVQAGEVIGAVGCTGYCTKPHLHLQVKKHGRVVDPAKYMKAYPKFYEADVRQKIAGQIVPYRN